MSDSVGYCRTVSELSDILLVSKLADVGYCRKMSDTIGKCRTVSDVGRSRTDADGVGRMLSDVG